MRWYILVPIFIVYSNVFSQDEKKCDLTDRFKVDVSFGLQDMKMEVYNDYLSTHDRIGNLEESYPPIDYGYIASISVYYRILKSKNLLTNLRYGSVASNVIKC